ncbi:transmembrane protein 119-like [Alosa pseudoharengus]|uniref:transmembrane protein 119-like n=1 Tax=Alosa pseudoharengus TaxID=34774 RepID=UPI003F8A2B3E
MHFSTVLCWVSLTITLYCSCQIEATPLAFNISAEGSGETDEIEMIPTSARGARIPPLAAPTVGAALDKTQVEPFHMGQVVDFLRENLFPILVISSLLVLVLVIISCASILSHKRKVSAYYPCSFPSKMYVDQSDKSGGAKIFSEVPEKEATVGQQGEPARDSARRLQEDILMIAKNLRSPSKGVRVDKEGKGGSAPKLEETDKSTKNEDATQVAASSPSGQETNPSQPASDAPQKEEEDDNVNQHPALSPETHTGKLKGLEEEGLPKEGDTSPGPQSSEGPQETEETQETDSPATALLAGEKTAF